jgi:hypothetical protein
MSFINQLLSEELKLERPWRLSEKHLTIVVPVAGPGGDVERCYVLLEETKTKLTDSGVIDKVDVKGGDKPILARSGLILQGIGTQTRAVQGSTIILPGKEAEVPLKCVYATKGISTGASFSLEKPLTTPSSVHSTLMMSSLGHASQTDVWHSARAYSYAWAPPHRRRYSESAAYILQASDDLYGTMRNITDFNSTMKELLSKIPMNLKNQIGMFVIDETGVLGVELFDHPDSWAAACDAVAKKYADTLARETEANADPFAPKEDAVKGVVRTFIESLKDRKEKEIQSDQRFRIVAFETEQSVGERVMLDGKEIHFVATRKVERRREVDKADYGTQRYCENAAYILQPYRHRGYRNATTQAKLQALRENGYLDC